MDNKEIENEIEKIKLRNKKVELDKAWETSWVRKICICIKFVHFRAESRTIDFCCCCCS